MAWWYMLEILELHREGKKYAFPPYTPKNISFWNSHKQYKYSIIKNQLLRKDMDVNEH